MNRHGVYCIRHLESGKLYIGSAAGNGGITKRWSNHMSDLILDRHPNQKLQRAWNKYGQYAFIFEVLLYCNPQDCLTNEQNAIDLLKPAYNICKIAGNTLGRKHTKTTIAKIRVARQNQKEPRLGKRHSEETKLTITLKVAKLTPSDIQHIREKLAKGCSQTTLAKECGVSRATIGDIKHQRTWRSV